MLFRSFLGQTKSLMPSFVWKAWATPKSKIFAWLVLQNRVWTADRLQRRGWPNCGRCKLCNQVQESAAHLLFKCRFTVRVWSNLKTWLALNDLDTSVWHGFRSVKEWWFEVTSKRGDSRKAMASLIMLVSWEIWKERNGRVFRNESSTAIMIISKIKEEVIMWGFAGAKALCNIMPRE